MPVTIQQPRVAPLPAARPVFGSFTDSGPGLAERVGFWFVLTFVFVVFARLPEVAEIKFGITLPAMVIVLFAAVAALFAANPRRLVKMRGVMWLLAFTGWLMLAAPFSTWRGGTFEMFRDVWSKSVLSCLVMAMLVISLENVRKLMYALAYATVVIVLAGLFWSTQDLAGRLTILAVGTLSNPNEVASRLLIGFCFCLFLLSSEAGVGAKRLLVGLALPAIVVMVWRTGSRSGMLTLMVLCFVLTLSVSFAKRVLVLGGGALLYFILVLFLPGSVGGRYALMFSTPQDVRGERLTEEEKMAVGSNAARTLLIQESLGLILSHPLFGVGPGVYASAAAAVAKVEGRRAMWHETHNTYLQLGAENGIPGLLLYLLAIGYCVKQTYTLYRKCRNIPQLAMVSRMAYYLLLALLAWSMSAMFDSQAYRLEFPMLAALTCAFVLAAEPQVNRVMASLAARSQVPASSLAAAQPVPLNPLSNPPGRPNPFRFGRMRTY